MCRLFTDFDKAVLHHDLFKMDTVGDAYIAAGFLPKACILDCIDGDGIENVNAEANAAASRICQDILALSGAMLASVGRYRKETGKDIHCRIGISAGPILAGVLGRLQPRFHIFGSGLRGAERQEQSGAAGAVHVSESFLRLVKSCVHPSENNQLLSGDACRWVVQSVGTSDGEDDGDSKISAGLKAISDQVLYIEQNALPIDHCEVMGDCNAAATRGIAVASDPSVNLFSVCPTSCVSDIATQRALALPPNEVSEHGVKKRNSFLLFPFEEEAEKLKDFPCKLQSAGVICSSTLGLQCLPLAKPAILHHDQSDSGSHIQVGWHEADLKTTPSWGSETFEAPTRLNSIRPLPRLACLPTANKLKAHQMPIHNADLETADSGLTNCTGGETGPLPWFA